MNKQVVLIAYNAGNTTSVQYALKRLGYTAVLSADPRVIAAADKVIFPGVGEARSAMRFLQLTEIPRLLPSLRQPVLGICLGMQLMSTSSEEGNTPGLHIFDTAVKAFPAGGIVPHMGWNNVQQTRGPLFKGINSDEDFYFVHSYCADRCAETIGVTDYVLPFSAALQKQNFFGVQFHPEKSGEAGIQLLKNFLAL